MAAYTKEEFRKLWEGENCPITFDDVADCAVSWGISSRPRTEQIDSIRYKVLKAASVSDAEEYRV